MSRDRFHDDMDALEVRIGEMARHAKGMLQGGARALSGLDRAVAEEVVSQRDALAQMDEEIETMALRILALQAPVARDLRRMGAALKLITYMNRIGRYGYDIARVARDWPEGRTHIARMVNLRDMAEKVERMMDLVIEAFAADRAADEVSLIALEEDVDAMRYAVWRECLTYMAEDSTNIEPCAHYMMVARYLERCGDNVVKMAEKLHYAVTGERVLLS